MARPQHPAKPKAKHDAAAAEHVTTTCDVHRGDERGGQRSATGERESASSIASSNRDQGPAPGTTRDSGVIKGEKVRRRGTDTVRLTKPGRAAGKGLFTISVLRALAPAWSVEGGG